MVCAVAQSFKMFFWRGNVPKIPLFAVVHWTEQGVLNGSVKYRILLHPWCELLNEISTVKALWVVGISGYISTVIYHSRNASWTGPVGFQRSVNVLVYSLSMIFFFTLLFTNLKCHVLYFFPDGCRCRFYSEPLSRKLQGKNKELVDRNFKYVTSRNLKLRLLMSVCTVDL